MFSGSLRSIFHTDALNSMQDGDRESHHLGTQQPAVDSTHYNYPSAPPSETSTTVSDDNEPIDYQIENVVKSTVKSSTNGNDDATGRKPKPHTPRWKAWFQREPELPLLPTHRQGHHPSATKESSHDNEMSDQHLFTGHRSLDQEGIKSERPPSYTDEARDLVRTFTHRPSNGEYETSSPDTYTPTTEKYLSDIHHNSQTPHYKPSVFAAILASRLNHVQDDISGRKEHHAHRSHDRSRAAMIKRENPRHKRSHSHDSSGLSSGTTTPKKVRWHDKPENSSTAGFLIQAAMSSTSLGLPGSSAAVTQPKLSRSRSYEKLSSAIEATGGTTYRHQKTDSLDSNKELVAEVADIIARRKYLTKLCGAFMQYGAPTHRMEAYLTASARALSIEADFLYIPGAMVCTFIDHSILANNVEVVRKTGGLDFGRLKDVFNIYKCVIHEKYTAQEGMSEIDAVHKRPDRHSELFRILMFGLASVTAGPFSFTSRPIDFAPIFILGCALGFLQIKVVPRSEQFSNVFEVFACVLIAFIARGLGSIRWGNGDYIFCFSAVAQSSIAMILPGFLVLNSALELQGRNMVSGSVRMVYAIIYVLFLGFGLLIGTTIFGLIKRDAVDSVTCQVPDWFSPDNSYKLLYTRFIWAPLFACCLAMVYQAKWRQLPVMALIAVAGHQANYWISTQLSSNLQVANAIGAFVIGCLANLYSRLFHGLAAAAMLPAIYCQVPGGLAASGSLVAGVVSSNQIFGSSSSVSVVNNGTQGFVAAQNDPNSVYGGTIYNSGYGMVQVSIGISVGLYLSALVVYPFGKGRSGLFSF